MKFPEIPTDNLYKFMAIFGLILVIAPYLSIFYAYKLTDDAIRLEGEIETLKKEIELDSSCIDNLKKKKHSDYIEMQRKQSMSLVQLNNKIEEHKNLVLMISAQKSLCLIVVVIGGCLIFLGFTLWYEKLQRPRDIILRNKAEKISQNNK
ncbi:MAG: hypothetical protein ABSG99_03505 [Sedimentisphaerales bacterium]